jgi:hypothetical protein
LAQNKTSCPCLAPEKGVKPEIHTLPAANCFEGKLLFRVSAEHSLGILAPEEKTSVTNGRTVGKNRTLEVRYSRLEVTGLRAANF